jgi:hypothetical protein
MAALTTDIETAVSGVTVVLTATNPTDLVTADLPWCRLLLVDYAVEALDFQQEERVWTFAGLLVVDGGTREAMQVLLEGLRDQVFADLTLGSTVHRATCAPLVPYSNADDPLVYGEFSVQASKVV